MSEIEFSKELQSNETNIPGVIVFDLPVHGDNRGWFKENWQREKMTALGLPDFGPVQNNISFNENIGTTRGIHGEPWDKYVSVASGRIFGAWVDLREGESFGQVFTLEMDSSKAIYIPRGVANAFQTLEENTVYSYLVNDHWRADATDYSFLNLADETANIQWPIPLEKAELSEKDKNHPRLADVTPVPNKKTLVVGGLGQLGTALQAILPDAEFVDRDDFDMTNPEAYKTKNWRDYDTIINVAAYTAVDQAETPEGRKAAWEINAAALKHIAKVATKHGITLVHISSEYVFDGTNELHDEDEPLSPLGVYAQTKAAGDLITATVDNHYLVRTSWVIGEGNNFVRTMKGLAEKGVKPSVVNDQIGRLTFTKDLAEGIVYLLKTKPAFGTYNLSNTGNSVSWADIAKIVYEKTGKSADDVTPVSTEQYYEGKTGISPRPLQSTLKLDKIESVGFHPRGWRQALDEYLKEEN
ncbi:MAG: bifunctional dTDP-4-dehydrorhamnose 3,5-epimerase family protein/NAD(P)-dependent oxidoreductase [Candidatus Saccharibacteria bacterium]|nr:bifunctional dTDP-4-dehydrorhamnose 3,5-epimerase family protein/NAD(P)-dependent oxidoreductase [Candidatus Saccharibacteria bacterium]